MVQRLKDRIVTLDRELIETRERWKTQRHALEEYYTSELAKVSIMKDKTSRYFAEKIEPFLAENDVIALPPLDLDDTG
jgi:hypothetical protein